MKLSSVKTIGKIKVKKWKPFMTSGGVKRWKKEGSPETMKKMKKVKW